MIKILNYEKVDKGLMRASVDIEFEIEILHMNPPIVSSMIIRRIAIMEKNGRKWLSFPSFPVFEVDNQRKYKSYVTLNNKFDEDAFFKNLSHELLDYIDKHPEPMQQNASIFQKNR